MIFHYGCNKAVCLSHPCVLSDKASGYAPSDAGDVSRTPVQSGFWPVQIHDTHVIHEPRA